MRIYKELEALGFFKWYCTQYGGLNYTEYKEVYDDLPLDNIIRTELNACVFRFFREKYEINGRIIPYRVFNDIKYTYYCPYGVTKEVSATTKTYEEAELELIKQLINIFKL
jgi:hypothetical protein